MFLPQLSIQRPILTVMMSLALVLFGAIGLQRLPVRELPNIDPPIVSIMTVYPGANAQVVETEVTEKLEEEINSIEGIKTLTSSSEEQVSNITVQFNLARPIEAAAQDVRDRVARVRGKLPDDIEEPIVAKQEADANPVIWIALESDRYDTLALSRIAENQLKDVLQTVRGVSQVVIGGEKRFAIRIWLDAPKMAARGITVLDVQNALKQQNVELPSGRVENLDREMIIETKGELKTAEEFNSLVIRGEGATLVRLRDIGEARIGAEDERSIARFNGRPAVAVGIVKQTQANTIEVAQGIKRELEKQKQVLPEGIRVDIPYDESEYVAAAIHEVWLTLGIAFVLVVIVIYVFLHNLRSTIIPTIAIPVSIVGTFAALYFFGYSINILTMLALVLSIGIVVDDAIVVLENIHRHIEEGMSPMAAAKKAMDEIAFAVLAITVSLVAVFLPLAFQTSTTGRLFIEFALTVAGSVIISAFVALTLTPMLGARVLKPISEHKPNALIRVFERFIEATSNRYGRVLRWSLRHRIFVTLLALATVAGGVFLFTRLEGEYLPEEDKGRLFNVVVAPEGSTSEYTDRQVRKMEKIVESFPEVDSYFDAVALSRGGPGNASSGLMFIKLKDGERRRVQDMVGGPTGMGARFFGEIEGAFAFPIVPKAIGGGFGQVFQLELQNQDLNALSKYAGELANKLRGMGFLLNVRSKFQLDKPQLSIAIDRDRAAALGVSIEEISRTMQILFGGLDLSKVKREGKEYDVIVQLARGSRLTPADLDNIYVRTTTGQHIQLTSVVHWTPNAGPSAIEHYNRLRSAAIEATPMGVPLGTAVQRVEELLKNDLPPGFRYEWAGEAKDLKESSGEIGFVLVLALLTVFMVLAAQFESLVHPITIILPTVALAAVGAIGALWLMSWVNVGGEALYGMTHFAPNAPSWAHTLAKFVPRLPAMNVNLFSQIGMVLLVGLVTKNAILLVEFANQEVEKGKSPLDAMISAGLVRLRPILMTSFAMIAGILPIAIGFGAGAESRRPMGVAIVGGLLTSTFLTLIVIPVIYTLFADASARLRGKKQPAPAEPARELEEVATR